MKRKVLDALQAAREARRPVALVTDLATGAQALLESGEVLGDLELADDALAAAMQMLERDTSKAIDSGDRRIFVHVYNPPSRLIIVGAVHIAQALAPMASLMGYAVTIVDPRRAFATDARFPTVTLSDDWPDEAVIAASTAIMRTLERCAAAAQRNGDLEWLRRFAWFTERTAVPLH